MSSSLTSWMDRMSLFWMMLARHCFGWHSCGKDRQTFNLRSTQMMNNFRTQTQDDWQLAHGEVVHAAGKTDKKWNAFTLL